MDENSWDKLGGGIRPDEQVPASVIKIAAKVAFIAIKKHGSLEHLDEKSFCMAFLLGANWRAAGCPGILGVMAAAIDSGGDVDVAVVETCVERVNQASPEENEAQLAKMAARESDLLNRMRGKASKGGWDDYKKEDGSE